MNNSYICEFIQHNLHLMEIKLVKQAYKLLSPCCSWDGWKESRPNFEWIYIHAVQLRHL